MHLELDELESYRLFEEITGNKLEEEKQDVEMNGPDDTIKDHTCHMTRMKRCTTDLEALMLAAQFQKQLNGEVDCYLHDNVNRSIKQISDLASTVGTHDAVDLLQTFGHTRQEAATMSNSFGSFLKAASRGVYEPNKQKKFVPFICHKVEVNLYHPILHANLIQSAYGSFKQSVQFQAKVDPVAEKERESSRMVMRIRDVAQTHSRPLHLRETRCTIPPSGFDDDTCGSSFAMGHSVPTSYCPG